MLSCLCLHILHVLYGFYQGLVLNVVRPYTGNQILSWDVCCVIPAQNWFWSRDTCTQMQNLDLSSIMNLVISLLFQSVLNYFFNMLKYDKKSVFWLIILPILDCLLHEWCFKSFLHKLSNQFWFLPTLHAKIMSGAKIMFEVNHLFSY